MPVILTPLPCDDPVPPLAPATAETVGVVTAVTPKLDGCPILTRTNAFVVNQGVPAVLEYTLRDRTGRPINLLTLAGETVGSSGSSASASDSTTLFTGTVLLRVREWLGSGFSETRNPVWEIAGSSPDPARGVLRALLPASLVEHPGIYELGWGVKDAADTVVRAGDGILSVERGMFPASVETLRRNLGPPTLNELRLLMMDASATENLLLDDVEFKDEQLLLAITKPVQMWNEALPPIRTFTTRDFPFRGAWASGILGHLHLMAAHHYRRNVLRHAAAGMDVADKDKEREYMAEGTRLVNEYQAWMNNKKVSLNMKLFWGENRSVYSSISGW